MRQRKSVNNRVRPGSLKPDDSPPVGAVVHTVLYTRPLGDKAFGQLRCSPLRQLISNPVRWFLLNARSAQPRRLEVSVSVSTMKLGTVTAALEYIRKRES